MPNSNRSAKAQAYRFLAQRLLCKPALSPVCFVSLWLVSYIKAHTNLAVRESLLSSFSSLLVLIGLFSSRIELQYCANNGNYDAFNRLKTLVYNPDIDSNTSSSSSSSASTRPYISNNMQPHSPYQNTFGPNPPGSVTSMSKGHNPSNTFELQAKEKQKTEMKIGAP